MHRDIEQGERSMLKADDAYFFEFKVAEPANSDFFVTKAAEPSGNLYSLKQGFVIPV